MATFSPTIAAPKPSVSQGTCSWEDRKCLLNGKVPASQVNTGHIVSPKDFVSPVTDIQLPAQVAQFMKALGISPDQFLQRDQGLMRLRAWYEDSQRPLVANLLDGTNPCHEMKAQPKYSGPQHVVFRVEDPVTGKFTEHVHGDTTKPERIICRVTVGGAEPYAFPPSEIEPRGVKIALGRHEQPVVLRPQYAFLSQSGDLYVYSEELDMQLRLHRTTDNEHKSAGQPSSNGSSSASSNASSTCPSPTNATAAVDANPTNSPVDDPTPSPTHASSPDIQPGTAVPGDEPAVMTLDISSTTPLDMNSNNGQSDSDAGSDIVVAKDLIGADAYFEPFPGVAVERLVKQDDSVWNKDSGFIRHKKRLAPSAALTPHVLFEDAHALAVDRKSDTLYVGTRSNGVFVLNRDFAFQNVWMSGAMVKGLDFFDNELYVLSAAHKKHRVSVLNREGVFQRGFVSTKLEDPHGIAVDSTGVYIANTSRHTVEVFDKFGKHVRTFGKLDEYENGTSGFNLPKGVAFHDDELYVAEQETSRVRVFAPDGTYMRTWSVPDTGVAALAVRGGLVCAGHKGLSASGTRGESLCKLDISGNISACAFMGDELIVMEDQGALTTYDISW